MSEVNSRNQNSSSEAGQEQGTPMTKLRLGLKVHGVGGHGR